jgi:hypothetical protein
LPWIEGKSGETSLPFLENPKLVFTLSGRRLDSKVPESLDVAIHGSPELMPIVVESEWQKMQDPGMPHNETSFQFGAHVAPQERSVFVGQAR